MENEDEREPRRTLSDGTQIYPAHVEIDARTGRQKGYVVLAEEERAKGFVRPVRQAYKHLKCGAVTTMGQTLAETYARDPYFYSGTFCATCRAHFPRGRRRRIRLERDQPEGGNMSRDIEDKIVFGMSVDDNGKPYVIMGIPQKAWEYMRDGKTHNFDLTPVGLPIALVLFGCENHTAGMKTLTEGFHNQGKPVFDERNKDFSIRPTEKK